MRVHLIKKQSVEDFVLKNARSKASFKTWLSKIKWADWKNPNDVNSTFGSADLLGKGTNRVVFNIGGNEYRMICKYVFGRLKVHLFICWIGSHAAYTKLCDEEEQYTINVY